MATTQFDPHVDGDLIREYTFTIDQSEDDDLSDGVDLNGYIPVMIRIPSAWTAADITLKGSYDDLTYGPINYRSGVEFTVTVNAADDHIMLPPEDAICFPRYLKIATSAGQAADRSIVVLARR